MSVDPFAQMAALMLAQGWQRGPMTAALGIALDNPARVAELVETIVTDWHLPYPPDEGTLAERIRDLWFDDPPDLPVITAAPPATRPPPFAASGLPDLPSPTALAGWLDLPPGHLTWLADCDGRLARRTDRQGHYEQIWLAKRSGGRRLVEAPLPRLKAAQRRILRGILDRIPPHPDTFGFVKGRDCRAGAARHAGEEAVICCDLANFFPSIPAARVHAIFRTIGYSHGVARFLTGLTTTRTPPDLCAALPVAKRDRYRRPHLPQGAPTSPALANLAARRLDRRMAALARQLGANYSRYADDLTLSGDRGLAFEGAVPILEMIQEIVRDCGFQLNPAKTRIQRRGRRQKVTGLVVNQRINVPRADYDRLKAILTNCVRHGPTAQNRAQHPNFRAYLDGRIGWVQSVNPRRGHKLRMLFQRIDWT